MTTCKKIGFIKAEDPNLTGNNVILSYFENKESFQPGSMNIYYLPDLVLLTLAGRLPAGTCASHHDEDVAGRVTGLEDFDLVYLNPKSQQSPRAWQIASLYRKRGIPVVVGGTHVSAVPDECENRGVTLLIGEEDLPFDAMLSDFLTLGKSGIKPKYTVNHLLDLAQSPPPSYDILDFSKYGMIPIQATRGCPHGCRFCFSTPFFGKKLRHKPVEAVLAEIAEIKKRQPNPCLFFMDDNMLSDRSYAKELLRALQKEEVRWCTFTDISFAHDQELLELLPASGCSEVLIGFETVRSESMEQVSEFKRRELAGYAQSIKQIQAAGIGIIGSFVIGFDQDTEETFEHLFQFIDENMLHEISISILTPYPGTELFKQFRREGRLTTLDYGRYSDLSWNVNYHPRNLSPQQIRQGITKLLDRVYSKEMFLKRMRHFKQMVKERLT